MEQQFNASLTLAFWFKLTALSQMRPFAIIPPREPPSLPTGCCALTRSMAPPSTILVRLYTFEYLPLSEASTASLDEVDSSVSWRNTFYSGSFFQKGGNMASADERDDVKRVGFTDFLYLVPNGCAL